jgi:sulfur carrier protein ThiS
MNLIRANDPPVTVTIHLQLYSILREKLPPEARGRADLAFPDGATLADLLHQFEISRNIVISVNDTHEPDRSRRLADDDLIRIFSAVGGG